MFAQENTRCSNNKIGIVLPRKVYSLIQISRELCLIKARIIPLFKFQGRSVNSAQIQKRSQTKLDFNCDDVVLWGNQMVCKSIVYTYEFGSWNKQELCVCCSLSVSRWLSPMFNRKIWKILHRLSLFVSKKLGSYGKDLIPVAFLWRVLPDRKCVVLLDDYIWYFRQIICLSF